MGRIETVSLVGLGGIGSVYLSVISEKIPMENIRVIAGGERAARYRKDGVVVNGRTFRFPVCEPGEAVTPADLLLFAVKQTRLDGAIRDARGHRGADTIVLSLLNGVTSERIIAEALGPEHLLYSCVLLTNAVRTGDSTLCAKLGAILFGGAVNPKGARSPDVEKVAEFFARVGIDYEVPEDMIRALWKKFMYNVSGNQVSAVFRCRNGIMRDVPSVRDLVLAAAQEVIEVSKAEGTGLVDDDIQDLKANLKRLDPDGKTSLLQDLEAGRRTETDIFGGVVTKLAAGHGLRTPVNEMLVRFIHAAEDVAEHAESRRGNSAPAETSG
ncbi:MAG: 2-dehydropantoate 2-reductase [Synergistaceae bacterium]|jgi:2-dehydropantoate 2-reductase|nr:2-dehydropantoate 2-reductase [Synergistaceae bacterium]